MKRKLLVAVPLLCLVALLAWFFRPKHEIVGEAYVSERSITLWSSVAQVREQIGVLRYGEHVDVLGRRNENAKVRTASGAVGWVEGRFLIEPALWQRSIKLLEQVRGMATQARGRTKVSTNLRVQPGRAEPRLYQFGRGVQVEVVGRAVAEKAPSTDEKEPSNEAQKNGKEDWFLVRGIATRPPGENTARSAESATTQPGDQNTPIAGWVVARFVELDLPDPAREGTSSANVRAIAWFERNRVHSSSGDTPQYLVAGPRSGDGQACDFTNLRVYPWSKKRIRYETAFIENNLCGALPVKIGNGPKGEPEFRFHVLDKGKEERVYRLSQTVVRRIREDGDTTAKASRSTPPIHANK
ncbi:MAG: hypothetical protein PVS2B2_04060 [Candidatus Acidiferrum sp.]